MTYCVFWKLVGRSSRLLDSGCVDEPFEDYGDAVAAISALLANYAEVGRVEGEDVWRARRSSDADLEVHVWVESVSARARPDNVFRLCCN